MLCQHGVGIDANIAIAIQLKEGLPSLVSLYLVVENHHKHSVHDVFAPFSLVLLVEFLECNARTIRKSFKMLERGRHRSSIIS
jgi:hypothetical protein